MLRNKISKLIVSIMAAVMITGVGINGQAVKAITSGVTVESQVQEKNIFEITRETTQQNIMDAINNVKTTTLKVGVEVTFSPEVIATLNRRSTPLVIEVVKGGSIRLLTGTYLYNNGNITITRNGSTGPIVIVGGDVTIKGVKFVNKSSDPVIGKDKKEVLTKLALDSNTLDKGVLISEDLYEKTSNINNTFINGSSSFVNTVNVVNSLKVGETHLVVTGNIAGIDPKTEISVEVKGVNGVIGTQKVTTSDTNKNFSLEFLGLDRNTRYEVVVKSTNPVKEVKVADITTKDLKSTISVTNSSANIIIPEDLLPSVQVNLIVTSTNTQSNTILNRTINQADKNIQVTGLMPNTQYNYKLSYTIKDSTGKDKVIVLDDGMFRTAGSSLVTGGGNNGSSTIITPEITNSDIRRSIVKDTLATLEVSNNTAYNNLRDAKEILTNIKGVTATFTNGKLELKGLVPEKDYTNLEITYINRDGRKGTIKVARFTTSKSETKIRQFVTDVYRYALDRLADEEGFAYWTIGLEKKTITPDTLVRNLLNEREFIEKHKTTESKIEGLYQVIVNRKSDADGLKFWTNKYDSLMKIGYSDATALRILVDQMVNEQEFKNRVRDLGL